uniref:Uncharacterized protein n=1 Tax=Rhizophora mucronata TaxID=61149 RepID=A0A2P2M848_RHIMU
MKNEDQRKKRQNFSTKKG